MFMITGYSVITAWLISNFFFIFFICLSKSNRILLHTSLRIFAIMGILLLIRVLVPFEFGFTQEVASYDIYPLLLEWLQKPVVDFGTIHITLKTLLILVWLVVAFVLLYHKIKSYRSFARGFGYTAMKCDKKTEQILEEVKEANGYQFPVTLIIHKDINYVMEFGFFRQTILLPDVPYEEGELRYILHHELEHFANKTNWIKLVIAVLEVLFWWNPLVYSFRKASTHLLEIYCDHSVSKAFSRKEKLEYLECLLREAKREYSIRAQKKSFCISNFSFGSHLKQRFELMLGRKKNWALDLIISAGACMGFFFSYGFVLQPGYLPPEVNVMETINQSGDIRYENNQYYVYVDDELFAVFDSVETMEKFGVSLK